MPPLPTARRPVTVRRLAVCWPPPPQAWLRPGTRGMPGGVQACRMRAGLGPDCLPVEPRGGAAERPARR
eukprot:1560497-Lingulodinium_polyedra.AAC.1